MATLRYKAQRLVGSKAAAVEQWILKQFRFLNEFALRSKVSLNLYISLANDCTVIVRAELRQRV